MLAHSNGGDHFPVDRLPGVVTDDLAALVSALRARARRDDQRRLLVLTGDADGVDGAARRALDAAGADPAGVTLVGERDVLDCERLSPADADELLGATREVVVVDGRDRLDPNALGRVVGAADGGGLFVLLAPDLDRWPALTDGFDRSLAVPPHDSDAVGGRFRRRLVATLRSHHGVAIVQIGPDSGDVTVRRDGEIDLSATPLPEVPRDDERKRTAFPDPVYDACLTADQVEAVSVLGSLAPGDDAKVDTDTDGAGDRPTDRRVVVVEADRGRGKSSAAGLAAGARAADGADVVVTAPGFRSAREVFARASEVVSELGVATVSDDEDGPDDEQGPEDVRRTVPTTTGGRVRYLPPSEATDRTDEADLLVVDEAAALPVDVLAATLAADRVAYVTTVHGYEGAGRGFSIRFRDRLDASDHTVVDFRMDEPIRYAADDPVESWAFRTLLLDARPPVEAAITNATPESVEYRGLDPGQLAADEHLLREAFGLLVLAHYRTEPDDLARMLDAPNVSVRALSYDGHPVTVALLAREGGLSPQLRREAYEGARIRGHMLPDVLTTQLGDERAGVPEGRRVMRIATHHAVRSRGLGSHLLSRIREEFAGSVDWLGTGFGATPRLLRFWRANGYRAVHLSVTRNDRSGAHSVLMLDPVSEAGRKLCERHARLFADRAEAMLSDPLRTVDPDVVRETLAAVGVDASPELTDREWRTVTSAAYGPGLFRIDPGPFRRLALAHLLDPVPPDLLTPRQERLLVATVLQGRTADEVAGQMGFHSTGQCLRAVGDAIAPLVDGYGGRAARAERERYE
jgi:tRNA(Met) cytidine acetyltransferase